MKDKHRVREFLATHMDELDLTDHEKKVMRYRWNIDFRTLEETGKKFDITKQRVAQIEKKALKFAEGLEG